MKIAVIGTGNIGGTIARKMSAAGHDVRVANADGLEAVRPFADQIGAKAVEVRSAAQDADVLVLSVPLPAMRELPADLFAGAPASLTVIDTSNYYPGMRDANIPEIDEGMPESVWVSKQLGRPVVKAFNTALAHTLAQLGKPAGAPGRLAIAVAGDDARAKQIAMDLVNQAGFDPVDAGSLDESWRMHPSTPAYCCDFDAATMRKGLAAAVKGEAAKKRDQMPAHFGQLGTAPTHDDIIAMNRRLNAPGDGQAL